MTGKAKGMKRSRRKLNERELQQAAAFKLATIGKPCVVCGKRATDAHHAIEAQYLRRNHPEHVYDERNAVPVCRAHHAAHTTAMERIPRERLPVAAWEFAEELGRSHLLERYYPERETDAA